MISAILLLNLRGDIILSRYYRDNVSRSSADAFRSQVIQAKSKGQSRLAASRSEPVLHIDRTSFLYTRQGDVYIVALTKHNANAALIFQFLYKLIDLFKAYFAGNNAQAINNANLFSEETCRAHFVLLYELLDECCDGGYPQLTAINILQQYIKHGDASAASQQSSNNASSLTDQNGTQIGSQDAGITSEITGNVDWRAAGKFKYRKNEIFIDVLEGVNLLLSNKGQVLRADVSGRIVMKAYLSGMPEAKFGLNDKVAMTRAAAQKGRPISSLGAKSSSGIAIDDVTFHRCVKLGQFEHDRTISFIPPDGEFELMKYRITEAVNLPFRIIPVVTELGRSRVQYEIQVKGNFSSKLLATHLTITIPTPPNVSKCVLNPSFGRAKYAASLQAIVWKMKKFPGDAAFTLRGEARMLVSMSDLVWSRPPITADFQVPMFTSSGLHVRFCKVFERQNYETIKWVRYMTRAGQYQIRI